MPVYAHCESHWRFVKCENAPSCLKFNAGECVVLKDSPQDGVMTIASGPWRDVRDSARGVLYVVDGYRGVAVRYGTRSCRRNVCGHYGLMVVAGRNLRLAPSAMFVRKFREESVTCQSICTAESTAT